MFRVKTSEANKVVDIDDALFFPSVLRGRKKNGAFFSMQGSVTNLEFRQTDLLKLAAASFIFAVLSLFSGCANEQRPPIGPTVREFTDDHGRTVNAPVPLTRVVSLAPSITEMIFAAGAGDRLVGVTSYCDFPSEANEIRKVGDTQTPNVESIVALQPQLVIVSTASQLEAFAETLTRQGIAVYVVDVKGIDDVAAGIRRLGVLFLTEDTAEQRATEIENRLNEAAASLSNDRPRVFVQISKEPLFTVGRASYITELVERAGGVSVTKDLTGGYPSLSKETALAMDPDVIIISDSEDNREPNSVFVNSPAMKNGRVLRVNADLLSRPGPRLVDALMQIAGYLKDDRASQAFLGP
jgi:ABC-type Fe3+-hydroxamate transport system substrate-binding protein